MKDIAVKLLLVLCTMTTTATEATGIIGRVHENGLPVIYSLDNALPPDAVRSRLGWLTVISWKYDGEANNGMPTPDVNQGLLQLEDAIDALAEDNNALHRAYARTGNGLKEFAYYIHDQDRFMEDFNKALAGAPRYPVDIRFYQDQDWQDLKKLLARFPDPG